MKLKLNLIMMAVALLMMTACGSDNDSTPAEDISGTYNGYTVADFQYTSIPMTTAGEKISLVANSNGTCTISFESKSWGKFTIADAVVTYKNSTYTIVGSGTTVMAMGSAEPKTYDCTITGTISKDKQTVSLFFDVPVPMGGIEITFTQGDAPANMVIAAAYKGTLDMSVLGSSAGSVSDSKVTIKTQENGKVEVTLAAFSAEGGGMGFTQDIVIADVEVSLKDGVYTIKREGISAPSSTASGPITVTGDMEGTIENGDADITFNLKPGAMPMPIACAFTGTSK